MKLMSLGWQDVKNRFDKVNMRVEEYTPPPPLSSFVAQIWHYEGYVVAHNWERIMPSCGATLLINLGEGELRWRKVGERINRIRGAGVCGPQPIPFEIDTREQRFVMGVDFHLGGAAPLLGVPAHELAGVHVPLADICGRDATLLDERLVEARGASERFRILQKWLLGRAARRSGPCPLVAQALSLVEQVSVASTVSCLGISPKRLIRAFNAELGLPPKQFCRVRRFERMIKSLEGSASVNWALTAAQHGYYDQAHLAHEFRDLSGYSPTEYLALRGPFARHVPLSA